MISALGSTVRFLAGSKSTRESLLVVALSVVTLRHKVAPRSSAGKMRRCSQPYRVSGVFEADPSGGRQNLKGALADGDLEPITIDLEEITISFESDRRW